MKKTIFLVVALLVPFLGVAQGVQPSQPVASTFTSTAPSGTAGLRFTVNGARLDLGTAAGDCLYSDGTGITTCAALSIPNSYALSMQFLLIRAVALFTCSAGYEGHIVRQASTGGTNSGSQTRFCACISDGAASPTYSWRNLISGTAGNSTTCNP